MLGAVGGIAGPAFVDVAPEAGLTDVFYCGRDDRKDYILETLGGGVALLDYDRDGFLDAFFVSGTTLESLPPGARATNRLYRNRHDGEFEDVTDEAGIASEGWGQGVCVGDIDNDGFDDLFVTFYGPNRLLRNDGSGSFVDVTVASGVAADSRWSTGCAFLDYDRDGLLDLYVANYLVFDRDSVPARGSAPSCRWKGHAVPCGPRGLPAETDELYRNLGDRRFEDVTAAAGVLAARERYSLSVTTLDFDEDGWTDIYVAVDSQASALLRNDGHGAFEEVGLLSGVALDEHGEVQAGMGSAAADLNGDGHLDIFKTNFIDETSNVYLSSGSVAFEDRVHAMGAGVSAAFMGWGVGALDFDRDTWPDLLVVNGHVYPGIESRMPNNRYRQRKLLYRNVGGRMLEEIGTSAGPGITEPHSSRGLAVGDHDNDGDVDVFVNNMNERPSLLRNDTDAAGGFLSLELVGTQSNRDAIGARVIVRTGERVMVREVRSGSSFMSSSDFRLHFGMGPHERADSIEIDWPYPSSRDVLTDVPANRFVRIVEGAGISEGRDRPYGPPRAAIPQEPAR